MQRSEPLHRSHVLRDAAEGASHARRHVEGLPEPLRELPGGGEAEHGNDPSAQQGPEDLAFDLPRHLPVPGPRKPRLLAQDPCVQRPGAPAPGSIPSSSTNAAAGLTERLQRLRLPAASVERQHSERADPLPQRRRRGERLELADHLAMEAELDVGSDPLFERVEPQLLQSSDLTLGELLPRQVAERRAAPERERRA